MRKSKEIHQDLILDNINILSEGDILSREELFDTNKVVSRYVKIEPCHSDVYNGPIMFQNTRIIFKILKNKDGSYKMPYANSIEKFKKEYPSIANRFIKDNKWDKEEIERFQFVVNSIGLTLDISNNYDKFIYDLLQYYPEFGKSRKPSNINQKFSIIDTEEIAKENTLNYKSKKNAYDIFEKLGTDDKLYINAYLGKPTMNISNQVLDSNILEYIETKPTEFVSLYNKIETVRDIGLIAMLIEREVIKRLDGSYYYNEIRLGTEIKEIVSFINKPNNGDLRNILKSRINL